MKTVGYHFIAIFVCIFLFGVGQGNSQQLKRALSQGYCCVSGKINTSDGPSCKRNKGVYFASLEAAKKGCVTTTILTPVNRVQIKQPSQGFCCVNGDIVKSTEEACNKKRGRFSLDRTKAGRMCDTTKGFCCDKGELLTTTKGECNKKKGNFSVNKLKVERICNDTKGFCCDKGRIADTTKVQCDKKQGDFYILRQEAQRKCQKVIPPISKSRLDSKSIKSATGIRPAVIHKPMLLPDLKVGRVWLNRGCVMQVDLKNNGGPISKKNFNRARTSISAGQGNTIPEAKKYLRYADPTGNLRKAGGMVTFNTGLVVAGTSQSLVWLDTEHHIKELNEQNNGDDTTLFCKAGGVKKDFLGHVAKKKKPTIAQLPPQKTVQKYKDQSPPVPPPLPDNGDIEECPIDLAVTVISVDPERPKIGLDHFSVDVTVKNLSSCDQHPTTPSAYIELFITDYPYTLYNRTLIQPFTVTIPHLDAGEEHSFHRNTHIAKVYGYQLGVQTVTTQPGPYEIRAVVNTTAFQLNDEVNSANNTKKKYIDVRDPEPSDLMLQDISLTPDCRLRVRFTNQGADIPLIDFENPGVKIRASKDGWHNEQVSLKEADPNEHVVTGHTAVYNWPASQHQSQTMGLGIGQTATFTVAIDPYHHVSDSVPYNHGNPTQGNNYLQKTLTCY